MSAGLHSIIGSGINIIVNKRWQVAWPVSIWSPSPPSNQEYKCHEPLAELLQLYFAIDSWSAIYIPKMDPASWSVESIKYPFKIKYLSAWCRDFAFYFVKQQSTGQGEIGTGSWLESHSTRYPSSGTEHFFAIKEKHKQSLGNFNKSCAFFSCDF